MGWRMLVATFVLGGCACGSGVVVWIEGSELSFCATVAESAADRMRGLRGAAPLEVGEALLLRFPIEGEVCIVNDGVSFPLDVLYADTDGLVVAVERDVAAGDATPRCHLRVRSVLEVAAGGAETVAVGDRVTM